MDPDFKTKILLVDDRPENLLALEAILEPLDQTLVLAHSGEEALKQILKSDFAVILLDVQMPGLDGFETAALIKERERSRHIPIIFLTAISKDEHYVFKGYTVGAVDYISKPFSPDILRSKVAVFVDLYRKNEQIKHQAQLLRLGEQRERERQVAELKAASERRYKQLAESMPQIVWTARGDGTPTYFNERWLDYTQLSAEEAMRLGWYAVAHADDLEPVRKQWRRSLEDGASFEAMCRFRRAADATYRWHLVRAVAIRSETGEIAMWIGTSTDIDDRKRAEEAIGLLAEASTILASSLDYRATLADVARLAVPALGDWCVIDVVDDEGEARRIAYVHEDVAKMELLRDLARRFPDVLSDEQGARVAPAELITDVDAEYLDKIARDEEHLKALKQLGMRSCITVPLVARGRELGTLTLATAGSGRRFTGSDLTLVKDLARRAATAVDNAQLYEIAQRERANLEEANRAKDEFLAMVSHELRTPLNSMLGWTQLLRTGKLDDTMLGRAIETIERNAKSQAQIIGDLLDVSRIVTGKLQLEIRPIELGTIIDTALDAVRPAIKAKNIELEHSIDHTIGHILGDPDRLQQVTWNLLSNAIKFTPSDGWIGVRLERDGDDALVTVADSGVGISEEFLPFVFERFRQADASSTRAYGGLGLGLSIVRNLVELHGGRIEAQSEGDGKGAMFRIWIPLAEVEASRSRHDADSDVDSSASALDGVRVLVVEDEQDGQEIFRMILERCGADVRVVSCVPEALDAMRAEMPDVLLSDIGLPGESGYDLIRRVRSLEPEHDGRLPAVALTAFASDADRRLALGAGFDHHMPKPVEPAALVTLVRSLIAGTNKLASRAVRSGRGESESSLPSAGEG